MNSVSVATSSVWLALAAFVMAPSVNAQTQQAAENMRLLGHSDLQGRSAYQPVIEQQGNRWIAYVGHHAGRSLNPLSGRIEDNGTSIIDVTDPKAPKQLAHIPGQPGKGEAGGAQMVRVCPGKTLPRADASKFYLLRTFGTEAHEIWDVTSPAKPVLLSTIGDHRLRDTHKNFWECDTGVAYLVSGEPGWKVSRMTQVYDLSNPTKPRLIRNFGLPGQEPGATDSEVPPDLHGMIRSGNRIYFAYGTALNGVIQIVDREKLLRGNPASSDPFAATPENLRFPEVSRLVTSPRLGAHTTLPLIGMTVPSFAKFTAGATRDFLVVTSEATANECRENPQLVYFVDITTETKGWGVANFQVPESEGDFCERGGRFGSHSTNENMTSPYHKKVVFVTYFNAGVRAIDVRDPFMPKQLGYFIPASTDKTDVRCVKVDGLDRCKTQIQTNNVEVDDRGFVYIVDRANTGLHILESTGPLRAAAGLP